jgi:hypothetical protein
MTHRHIGTWRDLADYGIEVLTGEACLIGARYLCDLDERGARIVRSLFGLPPGCELANPWNGSGRIGVHVASIKLPPGLFDLVATFCLFDAGCAHVIVTRDLGVYGVAAPRLAAPGGAWEAVAELVKLHGPDAIVRTYTPLAHPGVGLDATHAMSGRTT